MGFHINESIGKLPDIQRNYMWKVFIPDIDKVSNGKIDPADFGLRCRTAAIPSRGVEPIESFFLGMKQMFPGKPLLTNTLILTVEEFEDQKGIISMYEWMENIFSIDPKSGHGGSSKFALKKDYATDVLIRSYRQKGEQDELDKTVVLKGAWPSNIDEVPLDYAAQESVKYTVTFTFDTWQLDDKSS